MKAFVEILSGVVRAGPEAEKYGDPFELSAAFSSVDGKTAVIKALVSNKELKFSHYRAAVDALEKLGLEVDWYRLTPKPPETLLKRILSLSWIRNLLARIF